MQELISTDTLSLLYSLMLSHDYSIRWKFAISTFWCLENLYHKWDPCWMQLGMYHILAVQLEYAYLAAFIDYPINFYKKLVCHYSKT